MSPRYCRVMEFTPAQSEYLSACARIRDITVSALMRRLVDTICRDQLVLSILDDDSMQTKQKFEHRWTEKVTSTGASALMIDGQESTCE